MAKNVIHLHSSLLPSIYLSVSELHLQHTFTIRDGSVHFPYLENFKMAVMHLPDKQFGKDWAPKRWADLEVDPNSFSSYPRPNHAGLPGLPWGDTFVQCTMFVESSLWKVSALSFNESRISGTCHECESLARTSSNLSLSDAAKLFWFFACNWHHGSHAGNVCLYMLHGGYSKWS